MLNGDARLDEIMRRARAIRRAREKRIIAAYGSVAAALALALVPMIGALAGGGARVRGSTMGAFLLDPEAGGYVIVALLAFALGVSVTVLCRRARARQVSGDGKEKEERT